MAGFRKPEIPRQQLVLWSQRLDDALPADHPARLMDELFHSAALAPVFEGWTRQYVLMEGQPPYHPRTLALLYCYGLLNRLRSSRMLEAACRNRIDVIWLMHGQRPDHATIAAFVTAHPQRLRELFREVVHVGIKAGLVTLELAAIDGTAVEADAGRSSVHREETIRENEAALEQQIAELEREYQGNERREGLLLDVPDEDDKGTGGTGGTGGRRLAQLRDKQERMRAALEAIERRRAEKATPDAPDPKPIASTTDPDSRVMKDKEDRRKPNYNVQLVVDAGGGGGGSAGMILATHVSDAANDLGQLMEMVAQTQEECGPRLPGAFLADAGYNNGRDLAELEAQKIAAYIGDKDDPARTPEAKEAVAAVARLAPGQTLSPAQQAALPRDAKTNHFHRGCFAYDVGADTYRCPAGQTLTLFRSGKRYDRDGALERKRYKTAACGGGGSGGRLGGGCMLAAQCCKDPKKGREINRTEFEDAKERMREKMKTDEARARYKLRGQTVEPRIGTLKCGLQMRKFLRRGVENVKTEWRWACTALNIGVLLARWDQTKLVVT